MEHLTPRHMPNRPIKPVDQRKHPFHLWGLKLRPDEAITFQVRPAQWNNPLLYLAILVVIVALFISWQSVFFTWVLVGLAHFNRSFPFHYVTNHRIIQVELVNVWDMFPSDKETSIELNKITSVELFDPFGLGRFLGLERLDIFVAEGKEPRMTIRYQTQADEIRRLLNPRLG